MNLLNLIKCYEIQKTGPIITTATLLPDNWLGEFYTLLINLLKKRNPISAAEEKPILNALKNHVAIGSTPDCQSQIRASLAIIYTIFKRSEIMFDEKCKIALSIKADVDKASPAFADALNFLITMLATPQNLGELMDKLRFNMVDKIAKELHAKNLLETSLESRVFKLANRTGFKVGPISEDSIYNRPPKSAITDEDLQQIIQTQLNNHFQFFALMNGLQKELEVLVTAHGHIKNAGEHDPRALNSFQYCIKRIIPSFEMQIVRDIPWQQVKKALLEQLMKEGYLRLLHPENESAFLLATLFPDPNSPQDMSAQNKCLSLLIVNGYELAQCLEFFDAWTVDQKLSLLHAYLQDKPLEQQQEALAILHLKAPELVDLFKTQPSLYSSNPSTKQELLRTATVKNLSDVLNLTQTESKKTSTTTIKFFENTNSEARKSVEYNIDGNLVQLIGFGDIVNRNVEQGLSSSIFITFCKNKIADRRKCCGRTQNASISKAPTKK